MYPILFRIGPVSIRTFGVVHALAFAVGIWWAYREAKRLGIKPQRILDLSLVIFVWSLVGARLFSILFDGNLKWYLQNPHEILSVWKGGLTFYGGFLFGLAAAVWYVHRHHLNGWHIADSIAPALALGAAVGRLGCFASGDSFGKPTELPWAVTFTDSHALVPTGIPLHPTQIYSVITNLAVFGVLLWWRHRQKFQGELFLVFVILYAFTRSLVEVFRDDPRGVYFDGLISTSQIISILIAGAAVVFYDSRLRQFGKRKPTAP
ncbi:MAG: prolipoprotein diacylglyceryl transferase [Bacteroidota bacterium]